MAPPSHRHKAESCWENTEFLGGVCVQRVWIVASAIPTGWCAVWVIASSCNRTARTATNSGVHHQRVVHHRMQQLQHDVEQLFLWLGLSFHSETAEPGAAGMHMKVSFGYRDPMSSRVWCFLVALPRYSSKGKKLGSFPRATPPDRFSESKIPHPLMATARGA